MYNERTASADCLVIGGGISGLMAAREAVRAGCSVILIRDGLGASPWVHGLNIPTHPADSVDAFLDDTLASGQGLSAPALAAALCGDAPEILHEIEAMGLTFNRDGDGYQLLRPLGSTYPRVMSVGNETGASAIKALEGEISGRMELIAHTRALRLLTKDGSVVGALAYHHAQGQWLRLYARATVLATGGFCGIYPFSTNKRDSGGDGVAMACMAGAELCDMEFIQFEPSAAVWPESLVGTSVITTMLYEGAVLRNRDGERFMLRYAPEGERVGKDALARGIAVELREGRGTEHGGVFFDATGLGSERLQSQYSMYLERYRRVGIDLATTAIELAPAPHTSLGGLCTDAHGQTTLRGLFACGEAMGGLHGANRIGGSAGLETFVFGRRAGRAAAAYAATVSLPDGDDATDQYASTLGDASIKASLSALRSRLQQAVASGVGVLREHDGIQASLKAIQGCQKELAALAPSDAGEAYTRLRLENDLLAAALLCTAALTRTDTLGCHVRTDFPAPCAKPYRVTLTGDALGSVSAEIRQP